MESSASGTSQRFFSLKFLRNWNLLKPTDELIEQFNEIMRPIVDQRSILYLQNVNLIQTRDLLLPKLISGEIDIENLDIETEGIKT